MLTYKVYTRGIKQVRLTLAYYVYEENNRWFVNGLERYDQRYWKNAFPSAHISWDAWRERRKYFSQLIVYIWCEYVLVNIIDQ